MIHNEETTGSMILKGFTDDDRLIPRQELERIVQTIVKLNPDAAKGTMISVTGWWQGELRWTRNRVSLASDRRDVRVELQRRKVAEGFIGRAITNQTDDESLKALIDVTARALELRSVPEIDKFGARPPVLPTPSPKVWSDASYNVTTEARGSLARELTVSSEEHDLLSSGYLEMRGSVSSVLDPWSATPNVITYQKLTQSQCSMTVRHPKGVGSGWAGLSTYDWSAVDGPALSRRALDKCLTSLNPVAIEPGRYTVVLEPQAVGDMLSWLLIPLSRRAQAESGEPPFALEFDETLNLWKTKLGLKIVDERITLGHDPMDPLLGVVTSPGLTPVTWIERGVLTSLSYDRRLYGLEKLNDNLAQDARPAVRMSGGDATQEEMIASTKRGVLVTRFSGIRELDKDSVLLGGYTRDGLWLIENGKISKAIKNFRFTESPLFMLNQIDMLGPPEAVFNPVKSPYQFQISPMIVPAIKARDFSFTAMVDAV